jgi:hypothetical protein
MILTDFFLQFKMDSALFNAVDKSVKELYNKSKPLHHLPSARSRQYSPGVSEFFITTDEDLKAMSPQEVQDIMRYRHILVPGKPTGKKFDRVTLRSIGASLTQKRHIQSEYYIIYCSCLFVPNDFKVNELRTIENPNNMLRMGTLEDLLSAEEQEKPPILNVLDIPLGGAAIDIPPHFK